MKRHVQFPGIRKWSGDDLMELQGEGLSIADRFFPNMATVLFVAVLYQKAVYPPGW